MTPDFEVRKRYAKVGVVTFIKNPEGHVLLLQERHTKRETGKNRGDVSVLCETSKGRESWAETLVRGIEEELGIGCDDQSTLFKISMKDGYLGETLFVEGVLARVAVVHFVGPTNLFVPGTDLGEVVIVGWEIPGKLASHSLRLGVRNVLSECLDSVTEKSKSSDLWPLSIAYLHSVNTR